MTSAPTIQYLHCPLRDCDWRTVDRSHLGWVVVARDDPDRTTLNLERVDALEQMHGELLAHLAETHQEELQLMLAGANGGRGEPVVASLVQHLSTEAIRGTEDVVLGIVVPKMRAQLAQRLANQQLRPLDPWPAVQVRRLRWADQPADQHPDAPSGMRPAREDEQPDLYQLELRTDAVPDTRTVTL